MDSESIEVTASDINRLRAILFLSVPDPSPSRSLTNTLLQPNTRQSKNGNNCQPQEQNVLRDSDSGLPSVVQDSQDVNNLEDSRTECLKCLSPAAVKRLQAMSSQGDLANGTQLISQSVYEAIIKKAKSTRYENRDEQIVSQRTLEEGDSQHVDITSSFVTRHEQPDDLADSEPVDFSPVQTQIQLTQFPESQRFKTPAIVGRKRAHDGEMVHTPAPVANPFARNEQTTPGGMLGLSQAFAATQAASSPFSHGLPTGPRSDRPSPTIDLQTRPTSASSSPSLRPITDLRRAATEPASRYVPMRQSQAERERQERLNMLQDVDVVDGFANDFDEENSLIARRRRQRGREKRTEQEMRILSSRIPTKDTHVNSYAESTHTASSTVPDEIDSDEASAVSEAETEQAEDRRTDAGRSSQMLRDAEEDKENNLILVPKTGLRRKLDPENAIEEVDASPCTRHTAYTAVAPQATEPHSPEPLRIMDSQPSQSATHLVSSARVPTNSASAVLDFVEQSPRADVITSSGPSRTNCHNNELRERAAVVKSIGERLEEETKNSAHRPGSVPGINLTSTIPETSSDARAGVLDGASTATGDQNTNKDEITATGTDYETAPTHVEPGPALPSSQISSPIRTTPPGRKRRRLLEISAEPSPRKSQSQLSFDAGVVLQLDEDEEVASLLASSPPKATHTKNKKKTNEDNPKSTKDHVFPSDEPPVTADNLNSEDHRMLNGEVESVRIGYSDSLPETSQEIVKPGRQRQFQHVVDGPQRQQVEDLAASASDRQSIFDIQASPQRQAVPELQQKKQLKTGRSVQSKKRESNMLRESRMEKRLRLEVTENIVSAASEKSDKADGTKDGKYWVEAPDFDARVEVSSYEITASHMVLAYYKGDPRGYYPARVIGGSKSDGYQIQWEGNESIQIDSYGVKALDLRIGNVIKVLAEGYRKIPYVIKGFKDKVTEEQDQITDIRGYRTLIISPKQRKSLPIDANGGVQCEVPISSIYLDVNMWAQLKTREQTFKPLSSSVIHSGIATPLDRASSPSTPSSRGRRQTIVSLLPTTPIVSGMFNNMAFAISYDDTVQKNQLSNLIYSNGGTIVHDSFHDLLEADAIQLKTQYANIGFTALLTDRHSRKEKYMQALALGLPCLSGKWVEASVKHNTLQDWRSYLLPAGESAELDNATRSRVLPLFDASNAKLCEMLASRPNLLNNAAVIVVVGRGKAEAKRAPYLFLIQALGANQIQRAPDVKSAKDLLDSEQGKGCSWIFVDDKDVQALQGLLDDDHKVKKSRGQPRTTSATVRVETGCRVAGNELIVQSLILGRLYQSDTMARGLKLA